MTGVIELGTRSEQRLVRTLTDRVRRGHVIDTRHVGSSNTDNRLSADVVKRLALTDVVAAPGCVPALILSGVVITGSLDLRDANCPVPLSFENCVFEKRLDLDFARLASLSLRGSTVPSLSARGLDVLADLSCSEVQFGTVDLFGARIGGQLWLTRARTKAAHGWAFSAPSLEVRGGLYAHGFVADGGVNLWGAHIGASLELRRVTLTATDGVALRMSNVTVALDCDVSASTVRGGATMFGARVGGQLWLTETHAEATDEWALSAPNVNVGGGLYAHGFVAEGGVNLWGSRIGESVELTNAGLSAGGRVALRGGRSVVSGDVVLDGAVIDGVIDFTGAEITGRFTITECVLEPAGDDDITANLSDAKVGTVELGACRGDLGVDLRRSSVVSILDTPGAWPKVARLDQLRYESLSPFLPAQERLAWLRRDSASDHPQPYEQLAAHYRRAGLVRDARTVLLAKERARRRRLRPLARVWGHVQDVIVGYGYRPGRALAWLASLVAVVAVYFAYRNPLPVDEVSPSFNSVVYALDLVLPILDLRQEKAYVAHGAGLLVSWVAVLAGWVLASAVVAAITRAVSRD